LYRRCIFYYAKIYLIQEDNIFLGGYMNLRYVGIFFMLYSGNACIADLQNDLNQLKERLVQLNTALDALTPKKLTREEEIQSLNKYFTKFFAHAKQQGNYKDVNNSDFLSFVQKVTRYSLLGGPDIDEKDVPSWETEFKSRGSKDAGFKNAFMKAALDELSKWINEGNDFSQFALNHDLNFIIMIKEYRTLNGKADAYQNVREALIKAIKPEELKNRLDSYKERWEENPILRDSLLYDALLGIKIYREIAKDPTAFQEFETEINEWVKQEASKQ
jgi:hypothetical protein